MKSSKFLDRKKTAFVIGNSILALFLFFLVQKIYFLPGSDSNVFFYGPIIKEKLFKKVNSLNPKDYLLVNTNYDNMLVENMIHGFPMGNIPITDRQKLTIFFSKLSPINSHKYIICDIFFEDKSKYDDSLYQSLKKVRNVILPRKDSINEILKPFRSLNTAHAEAFTVNGTFYKYKLFNRKSKVKSIPLKMYEDLNHTKYKDYNLFGYLNDNLVFNDFIPEYNINSYNVFQSKDYPIFNLGELIKVNDGFEDFIKDKIIVIGNFNSDTKNTIYGNIPGPLVILNTYLSVENQNNKISLFLIIFLLIIFLSFSYFIVYPKDKLESTFLRIPIIGGFLMGLSYVLTMSILSITIYFIFNNNINLTYLALFFYLENLIIHRVYYSNKLIKTLNKKVKESPPA